MKNYELVGNTIIEVKDKPFKIHVSHDHCYCGTCFQMAKTISEIMDHNCSGPVDDLKFSALEIFEEETNRFDPYEALDFILKDTLDRLERHEEVGDVVMVQNQVYALRAYITGMER